MVTPALLVKEKTKANAALYRLGNLFFWVNTKKKRFNVGTLAYSTQRQHKDICPPAQLWYFFFCKKKIDTGNPALST